MAKPVWRLICSGAADGATNMAVDEAILEAVASGKVPPTLRFYTWEPPCLSLGYAQSPEQEVDLARCREDGVHWVRRPTGGRAILHADEVTYSLALPREDSRVQGDVVESYRRLSEGLLEGFRLLGLDVIQATPQAPPGREGSPACFDRPSHYEILCQGRKLVGSAQVRRRGGVLQHGAVPLRGDVTRIVRYLRLSEEERKALRAALRRRAITVGEALGYDPGEERVMHALAEGFARALQVRLEPGDLTAEERALAARLRAERYAACPETRPFAPAPTRERT
ncbi:MAG: lipoate--protein ligase family protein [Anaerolineae bacterium]|nr:lipoate--protein ligase family protein [Anaerolineae bacterium]